MPSIPWLDCPATGHPEMDEQHQELVELINELQATDPTNHAALLDLWALIRDYTEFHFRWEEDLMARIQFPGMADRMRAHEHILSELVNLGSGFRTREPGAPPEGVEPLRDWFLLRIVQEDQPFIDHWLARTAQGEA